MKKKSFLQHHMGRTFALAELIFLLDMYKEEKKEIAEGRLTVTTCLSA
jgi:hypothetical protein